MALDNDIATLSGAPLFNALDRDALRLLAFAAETRDLEAGEVLFRKGDRSDGAYIVTRGTIELDTGEGGSLAAFTAEPGTLIGQNALFVRLERPATATARERSMVMRISPTLMRRVLEEFPSAHTAVRQALTAELTTLSIGLEQVRRQLIAVDERRR